MKMYPRLIGAIAASLLLVSVSRVSAQDQRLRAQVPFAFTVGQTTLPSGTYEVTRLHAQTNVIMVRGAVHTIILMADTGDGGKLDDTTRLEFHRYADHYFLRGVVFERTLDLTLPATSAERLAAEQRRGQSLPGPETVAIVAQRQ
jgi:hypothetical protein